MANNTTSDARRQTETASARSNPNNKNKSKANTSSKGKRPGSSSLRKYLLPGLLAAALLTGGIYFFNRSGVSTAQGLAYLEKQETLKNDDLTKALASKRRSRMLQAVEEGKSSIFSLYNNSLIFGDSRVYGFGSYGFVPEKQVLADAGATILDITNYVDTVKSVQPEKFYFSYGVNDMGLNVGEDRGENGYGQVYEEQIDKLLEVSPHSQIIINSILPATPERVAQSPRWGKVDEYNQQIKALCEKRGWTYIDNSALTDGGNADIYQPDGVHLQTNFYPLWAQNMIFPPSN